MKEAGMEDIDGAGVAIPLDHRRKSRVDFSCLTATDVDLCLCLWKYTDGAKHYAWPRLSPRHAAHVELN